MDQVLNTNLIFQTDLNPYYEANNSLFINQNDSIIDQFRMEVAEFSNLDLEPRILENNYFNDEEESSTIESDEEILISTSRSKPRSAKGKSLKEAAINSRKIALRNYEVEQISKMIEKVSEERLKQKQYLISIGLYSGDTDSSFINREFNLGSAVLEYANFKILHSTILPARLESAIDLTEVRVIRRPDGNIRTVAPSQVEFSAGMNSKNIQIESNENFISFKDFQLSQLQKSTPKSRSLPSTSTSASSRVKSSPSLDSRYQPYELQTPTKKVASTSFPKLQLYPTPPSSPDSPILPFSRPSTYNNSIHSSIYNPNYSVSRYQSLSNNTNSSNYSSNSSSSSSASSTSSSNSSFKSGSFKSQADSKKISRVIKDQDELLNFITQLNQAQGTPDPENHSPVSTPPATPSSRAMDELHLKYNGMIPSCLYPVPISNFTPVYSSPLRKDCSALFT